jgi:predicted TIM-barrel fold metal-dependent hydrolase
LKNTFVDCEVHVLPPQWCDAGYRPSAAEHVITRLIYDHPDREAALRGATEEGLIAEMERSGISAAIIMGLPWRSAEMCWQNNEYVADLVRRHPGRFVGAGLLPPLASENPREAVKRIAGLGLRGVKVIPSWQDWRIDDARLAPALEEIEEQGMFLEPHTDFPFTQADKGDPPWALLTVLRRHPGLRVVAPHLAGMLCLHALHKASGDVFRNVLFVGSVPTTMRFIEFAVASVGAEQVVFGTDFPFNPSHDQLSLREAFERLDLTAADKHKVAGENAIRFLGL